MSRPERVSSGGIAAHLDVFTFNPVDILQLGDSIASGEGTLYGYHFAPGPNKWIGGNPNATWEGLYYGKSQAPFHPTPRGQEALAAQVLPQVQALLKQAP